MSINFKPLDENPDLVSAPVYKLAKQLGAENQIQSAEIDPQYMGGKEIVEYYGVNQKMCANCVIVEAKKAEGSEFVAVVIPVGYKADLNQTVKKHLGARGVSFAPIEKVIAETNMEFGSITPFGLPSHWKILVDIILMANEHIIVGGGKQKSKLLLPTEVLKKVPGVEVIEGLGKVTN